MRRRTLSLLWSLPLLTATAVVSTSCQTTWPRRMPTGEVFPAVRGTSLAGQPVQLPLPEPQLLLIGYDQDAQFDLDRWLLALDASDWRVRTFEVPTLPGLVPGLLSGTIDGGMRRGIPSEDWAAVVTVYDDAEAIAAFTGNEDGLTGRVLLLGADGRVRFFHDRGFSVGTLKKLQRAAAELTGDER
ncbi:MAG: hypothetical protein H6835_12690 [Planctomycetes bacterium]|nr:hypothetical protein [Planctomycetota bacterium]